MLQKIAKLKKLLNIDDNHIALSGILTERESKVDAVDIDFSRNDDFEFVLREKKKGVLNINDFSVDTKRDTKNDNLIGPNDFFPNIPFAMYILGIVKSGKSTLLASILPLYYDAFDKVILISPTHSLCPEQIQLLDQYPDIHAFNDLGALDVIINKLTKVNKGKEPKDKIKTLIIMDDCVNQISKFCRKDNNFLNRMALNRRHIGISYIMLSQHFRRCPILLRSNFSSFCLFRLENQMEKKKVIEELSGRLGRKRFEDLYNKATQEPYSFLSINFDALDIKYQYTKNFKEILLTGNEEMEKIF